MFYTPRPTALLAYLCGISSIHKALVGWLGAWSVCSNRKILPPMRAICAPFPMGFKYSFRFAFKQTRFSPRNLWCGFSFGLESS